MHSHCAGDRDNNNAGVQDDIQGDVEDGEGDADDVGGVKRKWFPLVLWPCHNNCGRATLSPEFSLINHLRQFLPLSSLSSLRLFVCLSFFAESPCSPLSLFGNGDNE